jgi:membrane-associated phospholipid phosphatase
VVFSILMGFSRAYLGAHWLSDAAAGIFLGTSCGLVTALVAGQAQRLRPGRQPARAGQPAGVPVPERQARRRNQHESGPDPPGQ